jgi:hypothetical protein
MWKHLDATNSGAVGNPAPPILGEPNGSRVRMRSMPDEPEPPVVFRPVDPRPRLLARLRMHYQEHPVSYEKFTNNLMYVGLLLVVLLSTYLLIFGG